ncbi:MAG: hypothetical protein DRN01_06160 [Thermoplasmata archaeon]|nr:MAG: hypothetical protein DRN01_06160 [Thermoplasmata archaeon]
MCTDPAGFEPAIYSSPPRRNYVSPLTLFLSQVFTRRVLKGMKSLLGFRKGCNPFVGFERGKTPSVPFPSTLYAERKGCRVSREIQSLRVGFQKGCNPFVRRLSPYPC